MIQTELEPGSEQFSDQKPAVAIAMALVERDRTVEVQTWSQAVLVGSEHGHG